MHIDVMQNRRAIGSCKKRHGSKRWRTGVHEAIPLTLRLNQSSKTK